jgi:thiamine pyrophosphate-dependent acetolactate synthase large subunit-like protein
VLAAVDPSTAIVSTTGETSFELCMLGDRPLNFYMLGSFGLASSISLGIALARTVRVVAIDGDGALLFNLGSLSTAGRYRPENLLHVVVDNEALGATGYQPSATSAGTDLAAVAAACGVRASTVSTAEAFEQALRQALSENGPEVIVVKVQEKPPVAAPVPARSGPEIRDRFMAALREA